MRRPGNLRTVAVTLQVACQRVVDPCLNLTAELQVDGERFELTVREGHVAVRYRAAEASQAILSMDYEAMVDVADGRIPLEELAEHHVEIVSGEPAAIEELMNLLSCTMAQLAA